MDSEEAAKHWENLADEQERMRDHAVAAGWGHPASYNARIKSYRNTAKSIRLMEKTGEVHCVCHLVPSMQCPVRKVRRQLR